MYLLDCVALYIKKGPVNSALKSFVNELFLKKIDTTFMRNI